MGSQAGTDPNSLQKAAYVPVGAAGPVLWQEHGKHSQKAQYSREVTDGQTDGPPNAGEAFCLHPCQPAM